MWSPTAFGQLAVRQLDPRVGVAGPESSVGWYELPDKIREGNKAREGTKFTKARTLRSTVFTTALAGLPERFH